MPRQAFFWKACQDINGEFELDRGHRSVGVAVVTGDDLQDLDAHPEVSHAWLSAISIDEVILQRRCHRRAGALQVIGAGRR